MARSGSVFADAPPAPAAYFQLYPPPARGGKHLTLGAGCPPSRCRRVTRRLGGRSGSASGLASAAPSAPSSREAPGGERALRAPRGRAARRQRAADWTLRPRGGGADSRRVRSWSSASQESSRCLAATSPMPIDDVDRRNAADAAIDVEHPVRPGRIARSQAGGRGLPGEASRAPPHRAPRRRR